jgi:hypothetical protein
MMPPPSNAPATNATAAATTIAAVTTAATTTATTTVANAATTNTIVELSIVHCLRKRQQQHHHQHTNGSTNMKMFTSPDNLDLFNISTVFELVEGNPTNTNDYVCRFHLNPTHTNSRL